MAVPKQTVSTGPLFDLGDRIAPCGTHSATCINVRDLFNTERKKFQSEEIETVDVTGFLFGFRTSDGQAHRVATRAFKISGSQKSGLFNFLKSWLGQAPKFGWDHRTMKGRKALIVVAHQPGRTRPGQMFAVIASISPQPARHDELPAQTPARAPVPAHTPRPTQSAPVASSHVASAPSVEDAGDDPLAF